MRKRANNGMGGHSHRRSHELRDAADVLAQAFRHKRRERFPGLAWVLALAVGVVAAWNGSRTRTANPPLEDHAEPDAPDQSLIRAESVPERSDPPGDQEYKPGRGPIDKAADSQRNGRRHPESARTIREAELSSGAAAPEACDKRTDGPIGMVKELYCRFQSIECLTRSQALAFICVLSLGPVLLFALAALGFIIRDPHQVEEYIRNLVAHFVPGRQASIATDNLIAQTHILESARTLMQGKWWAVSIGVLSLLWVAMGLFMGASDPINAAWEARETRNPVVLRLICLGVFFAAGALFLLSLVPSLLPGLIGRIDIPLLAGLSRSSWWIQPVGWGGAIAVNVAMFTVIYRFLPNAPVKWRSAFVGGAIAGVIWELFKKGAAVYFEHFANFDKLYGALGGAVLIVTWIWYSCLLLLIGAIACKMYQEHSLEGGVGLWAAPHNAR